MSRRMYNVEMDELNCTIDSYGEIKAVEKEVKSKVMTLSDELKEQLNKLKLTKANTNKYTVNITTVKSEKINEDKLINILSDRLEEMKNLGVIKTKEYIDEDALEKCIYNGTIKAEDLASCIDIKEQTRLNIKINK